MPTSPTISSNQEKDAFRVGIWCVYDKPLSALWGCRRFVRQIVSSWLELGEGPNILLVCRSEDHAELTAEFGGRVEIVCLEASRSGSLFRRWLSLWNATRRQARNRLLRARALKRRISGGVARRFLHVGKQLLRQRPTGWRLALASMLIALPAAFLAFWLWEAAAQIASALLGIVRYPVSVADTLVNRLSNKLAKAETPSAIVARHRCDAWLVLPPGLDGSLPAASVLLVDDPATGEFPEMRERSLARNARRRLQIHCRHAARCVSPSEFLRDHLLCDGLAAEPAKVRILPPPISGESSFISAEEAAALRPPFLGRPYLFVPPTGRRRPYESQAALVKAMAICRDHALETNFDLLFATFAGGRLAAEMAPLVEASGLADRIHFVVDADHEQLRVLFQQALAGLVIEPYEQGLTPLTVALEENCPVACDRWLARKELCIALRDSIVYFDACDPENIAAAMQRLVRQRDEISNLQRAAYQKVARRTWDDLARELLAICMDVSKTLPGVSPPKPDDTSWQPLEEAAATGDTPEVFLFLASFYRGGVWETTKDLVQELVAINRQKRRLKLTLGIHAQQTDVESLESLGEELSITRVGLDRISHSQGSALLNGSSARSAVAADYCFLKGAEKEALRADAWLALVDRFHLPLLPARPYGVIVYDMIQRRVPEAFDRTFFRHMASGMRPTVHAADLILVTSPATRADVIAEYGVDPSRIRLAPVACEPHQRFNCLMAQPVALPRGPFILNVANSAPHKGAMPLLRAYASLKARARGRCPFLVICGWKTDAFSVRHAPGDQFPYWVRVRRLVEELGLEEDRDVVFLGYVDDRQLLDLYRRCAVVVNAAKHDNGSFSVIEGRYFGRAVISSDYPASRFLCERFGLEARYFPVDEHEKLAVVLEEALQEKPHVGAELADIRARLADPELGRRRYAERVYDALVELAERGRALRLAHRAAA